MHYFADKIFCILFKFLMFLFFIPLNLIIFVLSRPLNERIIKLMEKYGREDVVKVLLMSGFTGLINLLLKKS